MPASSTNTRVRHSTVMSALSSSGNMKPPYAAPKIAQTLLKRRGVIKANAARERRRARELGLEYREFSEHVGLSVKLDRARVKGYNKPITTQSTVKVPPELGGGIIPQGVSMSDIRQIAGANGVVLRDAERLAKMYDGEPSEWVKLGGISKTENFQYDIHWYARNGKQYEIKFKGS